MNINMHLSRITCSNVTKKRATEFARFAPKKGHHQPRKGYCENLTSFGTYFFRSYFRQILTSPLTGSVMPPPFTAVLSHQVASSPDIPLEVASTSIPYSPIFVPFIYSLYLVPAVRHSTLLTSSPHQLISAMFKTPSIIEEYFGRI